MPSPALRQAALLPLALALLGCEDLSLHRLQQRAAADLIEATAIRDDLERFQEDGAAPALVDALGRRGRVTMSGQAYLVAVEHLGATPARQRPDHRTARRAARPDRNLA